MHTQLRGYEAPTEPAPQPATETLRTIDVIVTETSNVEYNKGAPETLEILNFMDRLGFKIFDITETHRKPLRSGEDSHAGGSGVLFQLDFLFVRKTSPLLKEVRSSLCRFCVRCAQTD